MAVIAITEYMVVTVATPHTIIVATILPTIHIMYMVHILQIQHRHLFRMDITNIGQDMDTGCIIRDGAVGGEDSKLLGCLGMVQCYYAEFFLSQINVFVKRATR